MMRGGLIRSYDKNTLLIIMPFSLFFSLAVVTTIFGKSTTSVTFEDNYAPQLPVFCNECLRVLDRYHD